MEIRLSSILLAAALLSGCSWFHRGDKAPAPVVTVEEPQARALDHRAAGDAPCGEDPEDQGQGLRSRRVLRRAQHPGLRHQPGLRRARRLPRDRGSFPGRLRRALARPALSSLEDVFPDITVVSNSGRYFTYYDLDVGYNVLPGEMFLGRGRAFNSALYVTVGMGDVKFADQDQFALNFGVGYRVLITDWLAHASGRQRSRVRIQLVRRQQERRQHRSHIGLNRFLSDQEERSMHSFNRKIIQALRDDGDRHRLRGVRRRQPAGPRRRSRSPR